MLCTAELLLQSHARTVLAGKEPIVKIGYHCATEDTLETIQTHGLLSRPECAEKKILKMFNGNAFGDGIYTADSYLTHRRGIYGETCILVVRLYGQPLECLSTWEYHDRKDVEGHDSVKSGIRWFF